VAFPQTARFQELLRRTFGIKGPLAIELAESVLPVMDITQYAPEQEILRGVRLWAGIIEQAAAIGAQSFARLENQVDSGQLILVERFQTYAGAVGNTINAALVLNVGIGAIGGTMTPRDWRRLDATSRGNAADLRSGTAVVGTTIGIRDVVDASGRVVVPMDAVVRPGSSLQVWGQANNVALFTSFWWRERKAEPEELS
jgi:hypothetical protein